MRTLTSQGKIKRPGIGSRRVQSKTRDYHCGDQSPAAWMTTSGQASFQSEGSLRLTTGNQANDLQTKLFGFCFSLNPELSED